MHAREKSAVGGGVEGIYAACGGGPIERVSADMERDRFLTAEQARDYGLVDRVIDSHEVVASPLGFRG